MTGVSVPKAKWESRDVIGYPEASTGHPFAGTCFPKQVPKNRCWVRVRVSSFEVKKQAGTRTRPYTRPDNVSHPFQYHTLWKIIASIFFLNGLHQKGLLAGLIGVL
jgi:hypothetical protein